MSASTVSDPVKSDTVISDTVTSETVTLEPGGSAREWAALDSQYERLIDPADPLLADRPHHIHGHGYDRPRITRWHPGRACA